METYTIEQEEAELVIDIYPREKLEELKERVRLGNQKLSEAWLVITKMIHDADRWNNAVQQWHLANVKLAAYCDQLGGLGFKDCLYIKDGKKYRKCLEDGCRVCPSNISYWEREFEDLGRVR